jgi:hypothetical protein
VSDCLSVGRDPTRADPEVGRRPRELCERLQIGEEAPVDRSHESQELVITNVTSDEGSERAAEKRGLRDVVEAIKRLPQVDVRSLDQLLVAEILLPKVGVLLLCRGRPKRRDEIDEPALEKAVADPARRRRQLHDREPTLSGHFVDKCLEELGDLPAAQQGFGESR